MLARMRKSMDEKDQGFTLIELLVVMIIIGILAAIAIPVFLNQRKKAADTATKSDVSTVGKDIASYYVDGVNQLTTTLAGGVLTISDALATPTTIAADKVSSGTIFPTTGTTTITYLAANAANCTSAYSTRWIIALTNTGGTGAVYYYSAGSGLTTTLPTTC